VKKDLVWVLPLMMLSACAGPVPPVIHNPTTTPSSPSVTVTPTPTVKPAPIKPTESELPTITAGSFCSMPGAKGVTSKGRTMTCRSSPTDSRNRWRS